MDIFFSEDQCYVSYLSSLRISCKNERFSSLSLLLKESVLRVYNPELLWNKRNVFRAAVVSQGHGYTGQHPHLCCLALDHDCHLWVGIKVMFDAQTWPQNWAKGDSESESAVWRLFLRALETHITAKSCATWIKMISTSAEECGMMLLVWHTNNTENFTHWLLVSKTNNCCLLYTSEELFFNAKPLKVMLTFEVLTFWIKSLSVRFNVFMTLSLSNQTA